MSHQETYTCKNQKGKTIPIPTFQNDHLQVQTVTDENYVLANSDAPSSGDLHLNEPSSKEFTTTNFDKLNHGKYWNDPNDATCNKTLLEKTHLFKMHLHNQRSMKIMFWFILDAPSSGDLHLNKPSPKELTKPTNNDKPWEAKPWNNPMHRNYPTFHRYKIFLYESPE